MGSPIGWRGIKLPMDADVPVMIAQPTTGANCGIT
jgi:hypothetical protein